MWLIGGIHYICLIEYEPDLDAALVLHIESGISKIVNKNELLHV